MPESDKLKSSSIKEDTRVPFIHSITFKHCFGLFLLVGFLMWALPLAMTHYSKNALRTTMMQVVNNLTEETATRIGLLLVEAEKGTEYLRESVTSNRAWEKDANDVYSILEEALKLNPQIFLGAAIAFMPGIYSGEIQAYYMQLDEASEQMLLRDDSLINPSHLRYLKKRLDEDDNAYLSREWFKIPAEKKEPCWCEPYFDDIGARKLMSTYSRPFFMKEKGADEGKLAGIVTIDVDLSKIHKIINDVDIYSSGRAVFSSSKGIFFEKVSEDISEILKNCMIYSVGEVGEELTGMASYENMLFSLEKLASCFDLDFCRELLEHIKKHTRINLVGCVDADGWMEWVSSVPVGTSEWSLVFIVDEEDALASVYRLKKICIGFQVGFTLLLAGMIPLFSRRITKPIVRLSKATQKIAQGNLDNEIKVRRSRDELGVLANSINTMRQSLKTYIANLGETLVQQERTANELKIAGDIQQSFLPKIFTQDVIKECSLYAVLYPAKVVGGDLYSYFTLPDGRFFFTVGDVSGKGVPASLFMAVTLTLMKGMRQYKRVTAADILKKVGHELFLNNERLMFVTVFCAIFDPQTGILQYSNAGHLPPVILNPNKEARWLELPTGLVLGVTKYPVYTNMQVQLEPGDTIVVYTDGVNEAMNQAKELWGYDRLIDSIRNVAGSHEKEIVDTLCSTLKNYVGGAEQSDDITVMAVTYKGK